jgi:hypothetical protein
MWPFDQNNQSMYQQYAQAYDTGNFGGFDPGQALGYIEQFLRGAPPEMQQQVYQQHFAQMPYEQRVLLAQQVPPQYGMNPNDPWSMSQSFMRMGREQPGLLRSIFSHPVLMGAGVVLAGLIAKHMLSHHQQYGYGYNPQEQYLQQEIAQERREERRMQQEMRQLEREEERLEDRERHHHHHERDYW